MLHLTTWHNKSSSDRSVAFETAVFKGKGEPLRMVIFLRFFHPLQIVCKQSGFRDSAPRSSTLRSNFFLQGSWKGRSVKGYNTLAELPTLRLGLCYLIKGSFQLLNHPGEQ